LDGVDDDIILRLYFGTRRNCVLKIALPSVIVTVSVGEAAHRHPVWKKARRLSTLAVLDIDAASYRLCLKEDGAMVAVLLIFGLLVGLGPAEIRMDRPRKKVKFVAIKGGPGSNKKGFPRDQKPSLRRGEAQNPSIGEPHPHHSALTLELVPPNQ